MPRFARGHGGEEQLTNTFERLHATAVGADSLRDQSSDGEEEDRRVRQTSQSTIKRLSQPIDRRRSPPHARSSAKARPDWTSHVKTHRPVDNKGVTIEWKPPDRSQFAVQYVARRRQEMSDHDDIYDRLTSLHASKVR